MENVTSFLKIMKQVEVCEPVQWLLHAQDWKIFNNQLSCRALRSWRIFEVRFPFMILLVHSSPCTENYALIGGRGKANPNVYVLKMNHTHNSSVGIILVVMINIYVRDLSLCSMLLTKLSHSSNLK